MACSAARRRDDCGDLEGALQERVFSKLEAAARSRARLRVQPRADRRVVMFNLHWSWPAISGSLGISAAATTRAPTPQRLTGRLFAAEPWESCANGIVGEIAARSNGGHELR